MATVKILGLDRATTPGHSTKIQIDTKGGIPLKLLAIMHERSKGQWASIPVVGYSLTMATD